MTNSTLVCPVKIEYVTKNNIFGLEMMVKSGLGKFYEIPPWAHHVIFITEFVHTFDQNSSFL
jgi:hypothetical protein